MASKTNLFNFFKQVRSETEKVTWPTRRETVISTIFVLIMVLIGSLFLFLADRIAEYGIWALIDFFGYLFG